MVQNPAGLHWITVRARAHGPDRKAAALRIVPKLIEEPVGEAFVLGQGAASLEAADLSGAGTVAGLELGLRVVQEHPDY